MGSFQAWAYAKDAIDKWSAHVCGGSNDVGYNPMYGVYDGAYDGSWNWRPGYYPSAVVIDIGPVN